MWLHKLLEYENDLEQSLLHLGSRINGYLRIHIGIEKRIDALQKIIGGDLSEEGRFAGER